MDIKEVARKGGLATLAKHGREHYRRMGAARRKPDDQVTPAAIARRKYRAEKRKAIGVLVIP